MPGDKQSVSLNVLSRLMSVTRVLQFTMAEIAWNLLRGHMKHLSMPKFW